MSTPRIPAGTYRARCKSAELCLTSSGKEQIQAMFELIDPDFDKETVPWWGFFTEKTAERTMQSLRYCGWRGDDITDLDGVTANEVEIVVEHNDYNGKVNARVAWVNRIGSGGIQVKSPMAETARKAFARKMKALAVKTAKETAAEAPPVIDEKDELNF
jgi:hypothetical protein